MAKPRGARYVTTVLAAVCLLAPSLLAQGPRLEFLTDPGTDLGFAACYIYFDGGARHRIPFLPIVNAKRAPSGTERYTRDIHLQAPVVFVGDGIVREAADPYAELDVTGKVVMLSYDFPDQTHPDSRDVSLEDRVREAVTRNAAGVLLFSAIEANPFPQFRESVIARIPELPIIVINKSSAAIVLASDGRDPEETFRAWETEGTFRPGELITKLDLRIDGKFDIIDTDDFTFAFQPGIPRPSAEALSETNERAVTFLHKLFGEAAPRGDKTFAAYFASYDAKVFYVHHWGRGFSSQAGIFMWFDGTVPDFGLAAHENAHTLIEQNWGSSSSFLGEGIGRYAEAMATDTVSNHRETRANLAAGKLFPLVEMETINIGSDPRTDVAYPAAGSFVQFLIGRYSLEKLEQIYRRVGAAEDDAAVRASWTAVYGKGLPDLEREWLSFLRTSR